LSLKTIDLRVYLLPVTFIPPFRGSEISHRSQVQRSIFWGCLGLKINILSRIAPLNERFIRRQSERERPAARSKVFSKLSTN